LLRQPRIIPWDIHALILHARRDVIFRLPRMSPPAGD
jgi:hypothetical protein